MFNLLSTVLLSVTGFLLAVGIIVIVHEFGHLLAAKFFNIKVLRFSVGFGKILTSFTFGKDKTEYAVSLWPLGGYVKMVDEREGNVIEEDLPRAYNRQAPSVKIAVALAGPMANFLLAIVLYWLLFMTGIQGVKPLLDTPLEDSPAAISAIKQGDQLIAVNNIHTPTWESARLTLINQALKDEALTLTLLDAYGQEKITYLTINNKTLLKGEEEDLFTHFGIQLLPQQSIPIIYEIVDPTGAAAEAGLQVDDRVVMIEDKPIQTVQQWLKIIQANPNQTLHLTIKREGKLLPIEITPKKKMDGEIVKGIIGAKIGADIQPEEKEKFLTIEQYNPVLALGQAVNKTYDMTILTLRVLGKLVIGQANLNNISGPVTIAYYAGKTIDLSFAAFLSFIAIISISIGIVNLFPIPMLDGGHIILYFIEWIKGGPIPEKIEAIAFQIGMVFLLGLMLLAFYNDIMRFSS